MKTYDIVIPLKTDSHNNYLELRYALRSIEKNLRGFRDIWIVGSCPDWFDNGYHIQAEDVVLRKQYSLYCKTMIACLNVHISHDFLYWHDDHFLTQPLNVEDIPDYYDGTLEKTLGAVGGTYYTTIKNTIDLLGPDARHYDIHVPCIFNKEKFKELPTDWPEYGYGLKSLYMNKFSTNPVQLDDLKFYRVVSKEGIKHYIKDRLFFSTGAGGFKRPMVELLDEMFPEPSRFEKVNVIV